MYDQCSSSSSSSSKGRSSGVAAVDEVHGASRLMTRRACSAEALTTMLRRGAPARVGAERLRGAIRPRSMRSARRLRPRRACSTSTATPTTTARSSRSSGRTTRSSNRSPPESPAQSSSSTCAHQGAHPRGRGRRRPARAPSSGGRAARGAAALALADRLGELGLPVLFYGRLTEDGREPAFFRGGGTEELSAGSHGELVSDRARPAAPDRRRRARRRPPAADRVQRQPALRRRRGGAGDRAARARARRRLPGRAGARARAAAGRARPGEHERDRLGGRGAARDRGGDRRGGRRARGGGGRERACRLMPAGAAVEAAGAAFGIEGSTGATCSSSGSWTTDR